MSKCLPVMFPHENAMAEYALAQVAVNDPHFIPALFEKCAADRVLIHDNRDAPMSDSELQVLAEKFGRPITVFRDVREFKPQA